MINEFLEELCAEGKRRYDDEFFQNAMSHVCVLRSFLQFYLPKKILERVNLNALSAKSYVITNKELKKKIPDIVISAENDNEVIFIHIEHQSKIDNTMPKRMLGYEVALRKQHAASFPDDKREVFIVHILFQCGKKAYDGSVNIISTFNVDGSCHHSTFLVSNLVDTSYDDIKLSNELSCVLIPMKLQDDNNYLEMCRYMLDNARDINALPNGEDILYSIEKYLLTKAPEGVIIEIEQMIAKYESQEGSMLPINKYFNRRIQEGLQTGLQKGLQRGLQMGREEEKWSMVLNMLKQGVSCQDIARYTAVSEEAIKSFMITNLHASNYVLAK